MTPFEEVAEGLEWGDDESFEKFEQLELFKEEYYTFNIRSPISTGMDDRTNSFPSLNS